jgi:hypothetical protein
MHFIRAKSMYTFLDSKRNEVIMNSINNKI